MEISYDWQDGPEILHSNVSCVDALHEASLLDPIFKPPQDTGAATNQDGHIIKSNKGVHINEIYSPLYAKCSPTAQIMEDFIFSAKEVNFTPNSAFQYLYPMFGYDILFSAYKNGDYYKPHRDASKLTVILWLSGKTFAGGDLYFPDFNYTITYEPNKIFLFPSYYWHEVTPLSTEEEGFVRYCASAFIN